MRSGKKRGVHARRGYHSGGAEGSLERGKERKKERDDVSLKGRRGRGGGVRVCARQRPTAETHTHTRTRAPHLSHRKPRTLQRSLQKRGLLVEEGGSKKGCVQETAAKMEGGRGGGRERGWRGCPLFTHPPSAPQTGPPRPEDARPHLRRGGGRRWRRLCRRRRRPTTPQQRRVSAGGGGGRR